VAMVCRLPSRQTSMMLASRFGASLQRFYGSRVWVPICTRSPSAGRITQRGCARYPRRSLLSTDPTATEPFTSVSILMRRASLIVFSQCRPQLNRAAALSTGKSPADGRHGFT
jgi:hypothetical protein